VQAPGPTGPAASSQRWALSGALRLEDPRHRILLVVVTALLVMICVGLAWLLF
jgi:hypothetical protein